VARRWLGSDLRREIQTTTTKHHSHHKFIVSRPSHTAHEHDLENHHPIKIETKNTSLSQRVSCARRRSSLSPIKRRFRNVPPIQPRPTRPQNQPDSAPNQAHWNGHSLRDVRVKKNVASGTDSHTVRTLVDEVLTRPRAPIRRPGRNGRTTTGFTSSYNILPPSLGRSALARIPIVIPHVLSTACPLRRRPWTSEAPATECLCAPAKRTAQRAVTESPFDFHCQNAQRLGPAPSHHMVRLNALSDIPGRSS